jgi:hypothetical protein
MKEEIKVVNKKKQIPRDKVRKKGMQKERKK